MSDLPLNELHAFACVAQHKSFRKAAEARGVSASAISHTVRALETRLDMRLLHRTTRSVAPTEAGERLLKRLQPAFERIQEALDELDALRETPSGTVRLNVPNTASMFYIAPIIAPLRQHYPQVRLEIRTDNSLVDIVKEGFDAGIRFAERLPQDMVALPFKPAPRIIVVGAPCYLTKYGIPQTPFDLKDHICIGRRFPNGTCYAWEFYHEGKALELKVSGPMVLDDNALMIEVALKGLGLICVYERLVETYLAQGRLVEVLPVWRQQDDPFYLYYPSRHRVPPALRALIDTWRAEGML